jgi:hypothetical protein
MLLHFYDLRVRNFPTLWSGGYSFVVSVKTTVKNSIHKNNRFSSKQRETVIFL